MKTSKHQQLPLFVLVAAALMACVTGQTTQLSGRIFDQAIEVDTKCRAEVGLTDAESLTHFMAMNGTVDQKFKCFIHCIMKHFQAMTHGGEFVLEEALNNVPHEVKEEGHKMVHDCKETTGTDPCDTAFQVHLCYFNSNPMLYGRILMAWHSKLGKPPPVLPPNAMPPPPGK